MTNKFALPSLLFAAALLHGCTDAGKCTRGEENCAPKLMNGRPMCDRDLRVDGEGDDARCVKPGGGNNGDEVECRDDSFEAACTAFCEAFCKNEEDLCVDSACPAGACEPGGSLYAECEAACADERDEIACAVALCEGQKEFVCSDFGFLDDDIFMSGCFNDDPICVLDPDYGCSVTCGETPTDFGGVDGTLANNGVCEDDGEGSESDQCAFGTDCNDCGPRECGGVGAACNGHPECCGGYEELALCVNIRGQGTCLETCTATGMCPEGEECLEVDDGRNSVCVEL